MRGRLPRYRATRRWVQLPDGDAIVLHDDLPESWREGDRVALLLHGLGGSHRSPYMVRLADKLNRRGVRAMRLDMRGCGAAWRTALHPGHAGRSEDAAAAIRFIDQLCPGSPVAMVGYSLGANVALKLAGELGADSLGGLDGCFAAQPPMHLSSCAEYMREPERRIYSRAYVRSLMKQVKRRREFTPAMRELPLTPHPQSIDEFDDRFTAPLSGFRDVDDYYEQASARRIIDGIELPTVIVAAENDPIIPIDIFRDVAYSASTNLHITASGGHCGYVGSRRVDPDRHWLEWRVVDWVLERGIRHPAKRS